MQKIEALLPPRPKIEIPEGEMVEEVNMDDYVPSRREEGGSRGGGHAYQEVRESLWLYSMSSLDWAISDEEKIVITLTYAYQL